MKITVVKIQTKEKKSVFCDSYEKFRRERYEKSIRKACM